ncbi:glycerophosphodiester phosphodiesterase [Rummeliibacillus stabekisii]|uniref:glycerophosphodiester phosphodiesterase family protein n=1 Tax=Rummeliibacillus stabekisii TaxID=241244 RepID=UPI00204252C1|nr:glycerophosphodiester phosphodiesterase family protein [Rummeliibacillus stabekisii]MCM3315102.1 glycerophosphodiester phosphodiesterase [Rummeliibacillus stabekisii]
MDIFAHRGASRYFPENTLLAFKEAAKIPIYGVELDVHRTKDGVLVVHHDEKINRTSNGKGFIHEMDFAELRSYDFGSWKREQFAGQQIPTLHEVLDIFRVTHHMINIELKTDVYSYPGLEEDVLQTVLEHDMAERIIYSSFDHEILERLLEKAIPNEVGLLFSKVLINLSEYGQMAGSSTLHVSLIAAKRNAVKKAIELGNRVRVYTVNRTADYDLLEDLGVDAIFTDEPEKMYRHAYEKKYQTKKESSYE